MLATGAARAQVQAPPDTAPGVTVPAQHVADGWDGDAWAGGHPHGDGHPPDGPGAGLIEGGLLHTTMVSGSFARRGAAGAGRWALGDDLRPQVARVHRGRGLRLDTCAVGDRRGRSGVRWRPAIGRRRAFKVRHPVGL